MHVRGRSNVAKRVLVQAAAFDLALILRSLTKAGTPRGLADRNGALFCALWRLPVAFTALLAPWDQTQTTLPGNLRNVTKLCPLLPDTPFLPKTRF